MLRATEKLPLRFLREHWFEEKDDVSKRNPSVITRAEQYRPGINMPEGPDSDLNKWSRKITQPKSQGASQAMLYATGLSEADMNKPQVGIFFGVVARESV